MHTNHIYIVFFVLMIGFCVPRVTLGQSEIEEERSSLLGLPGVGFTVDIEQNTAFADTQLVKIETIKGLGIQALKEGEITIYDNRQIQKSIRRPVLYVHLNLLSTKTGIISFGITASLYQPVKLVLTGDKEITASTWETSVVGIASYDKIGVIKQAAVGVVENFIADYHRVNSK